MGIPQKHTHGEESVLLDLLSFLFPSLRIAYPVVQMATQSGKNVYLTVTKESGNSIVLLFKMISTRAASGLYRAITETHAFYRHVSHVLGHLSTAVLRFLGDSQVSTVPWIVVSMSLVQNLGNSEHFVSAVAVESLLM